MTYEPERALADAVALDDAPTRQRALLRIAFEWGNRDPAIAVAEGLPRGQLRYNLMQQANSRLGTSAP